MFIKNRPLANRDEVKIVNPVARFPPNLLRVAASSNKAAGSDHTKACAFVFPQRARCGGGTAAALGHIITLYVNHELHYYSA